MIDITEKFRGLNIVQHIFNNLATGIPKFGGNFIQRL